MKRGARRAAPGRRRVLVLRVHALEGAAAPPGARARGGSACPGVSASGPDAEAVLRRRDEVIHDLDDSSQLPWLEERGIELVRGRGRLAGERRVEVDGRVLEASRAVVLAAGSLAAIPPIDGPRRDRSVDEPRGNDVEGRAGLADRARRRRGGRRAGAGLAVARERRSSLLEAGDCVLSREEPFAGELVAARSVEAGVDLRIDAKAERVAREDGRVTVSLAGGDTVEGERAARGGRAQAADRGPGPRDGRARRRASTSRPTRRSRFPVTRGCTRSAT